jgi:TPP-dependent pyruvate/acetoin dehydrogenase alpha subunit
MSDPIHGHYRTREEVEGQRKRDPISVWSQRLIEDGLLDEVAVRGMDKDVLEEVEDAYQFADQAPDPEAEELYKDVYSREERER